MSKYLVCYACDAKGHISKECPNKDKFVGGSMKENYKYCGRCDKYGHTTFECYSDGGPVNWSRVSQKEMKCYNCNDFGHIARNCPADKRPPSSLGSRASHVDRTLLPVKLNMGVSSLDGQNIPATPQSLLDAAVYRYNRKEGLLSSENSWLCASLMNSYDDRCILFFVKRFLITAAEFCNCLYEIYSKQYFRPNDFLQWLNDASAYEIFQQRDGTWKRVIEWREIDRKKKWNSSN